MIKKFLYIMVILLAMSNIAFGAEADGNSIKSDSLYKENRLKNDEPTTFDKLDLKCRALTNSDFKTQIIDFDIEKGITYCQVYKKDNPDFILNINADAQWLLKRETEVSGDETKSTITKVSSMTSNIGKSTGNSSDGDTLSTFMVKTVLLMDNSSGSKGTVVTHYDATDFSAQMENSSGVVETTKAFLSWAGNMIMSVPKFIGSKVGIETEITQKERKVPYVASASDGFNAENLAYYRALFNGMNEIYIHLQNLLFIVVGGFFLATLGGGKIQKYLENRGQSTGNKEPYLHKFFIPLLCAGVFYMPITSGGGVNSTMIQKIIQYFSIEANNIADKAGSIGAKIYMDKVYATAKLNNAKEIVKDIKQQRSDAMKMNNIAFRYYNEFCEKRWGNLKNAPKGRQTLNEVLALANFEELAARASESELDTIDDLKQELNMLQKWDTHGGMDSIEQDITLQACAKAKAMRDSYAQEWRELKTKEKEADELAKQSNDTKIKEGMQTLDDRLATRDEQLGWLNSILLPSSALILELQKSVSQYKEDKAEIHERNNKALNDKTSPKTNDQAVLGLGITTELLQQVTYLLMPGAGSVFNFMKDTQMSTRHTLCAAYTADQSVNFFGVVGNALECEGFANAGGYVFGAFYTAYLYEKILSYLPVLITSAAAILAFVGYIVTLCKYFYISPFVVAFALTTKRVDKIINFLVTGITIFFKPVLIVLFIYLALFLYALIGDFFVFAGLTQFNIIPRSVADITAALTFGIIRAMILFLGSLASVYVIWKTIMSGPDWTFKLLGLDKDSDNTIVSGLSQKLETKAVVV